MCIFLYNIKEDYKRKRVYKMVSTQKKSLYKSILEYKFIYLMLLPGILFLLVFKYIPMYGIQLAFKDFMLNKGISGSPWIGLDNFSYIWGEPEFWSAFGNTIIISFLKLLIGFPFPVVLAILINEYKCEKYKKFLQVIYTFPHFLSWVIVSGIMFNLLSNNGALNNLISSMGFDKINFLINKSTFRMLLVSTGIWKEAGWGTIIYLAAIAGINPSLYEAATVDGASRWQKIIHITWPGIRNIVILMFIMRVGHVMDVGFMQVLNMYNPAVYEVADIIDTYIYRLTFERAVGFGISTAVGLFKGVTNLIFLLIANAISKKYKHSGIF